MASFTYAQRTISLSDGAPGTAECRYDNPFDVFIDLYSDELDEQKRLRTERRVLWDARTRGASAEAVRQAYIDEYGGLALDLPSCLQEKLHVLALPSTFRESERMRSLAKTLLKNAIDEAHCNGSLAPEALAELHYRLGKLFAQDLPERAGQVFAKVLYYYEAALLVYTRDRYPRQYAKVQIALGDTYISCQGGDQWDHLAHALRYYEAALQLQNDTVVSLK